MKIPKAATTNPKTALDYVTLLDNGATILQANYGDGEWACMLGHSGQNSQGGKYDPKLMEMLRETVRKPRFTHWGTNPGDKLLSACQTWLKGEGLPWFSVHNSDVATLGGDTIKWVWKEALAAANVHGKLGPFIRLVREHKCLVIGPMHLKRGLPFKPTGFVEVPLPNAWMHMDKLTDDILAAINDVRPDLLLFSAGMATNVLLWRIIPKLPDENISALDCGAIWDPFAGVMSRSAYKQDKFYERLQMSLDAANADK